jgi:ribosomal protein S18 acetylase RimI-like enzyme
MTGLTHPATRDDVLRLWPAMIAAHLFRDREELVAFADAAPWRVRVTPAGEAAVLERWRAHLDLLAIQGIWCSTDRVAPIVEDLIQVARLQGFARLLGPLVPDDSVWPYEGAGLSVRQRIVVYRMQPPKASAHPAPAGVTLRPGTPKDLPAIAAVDAESFDEFWRYDDEILHRSMEREHPVVAEVEDKVIGYTLSTLHGVEATVGRLAVVPSGRHSGVGSALLADAVATAARRGAAGITLCTQEDNEDSRRLYRRAGFREAPGRLVSTISEPLASAGTR